MSSVTVIPECSTTAFVTLLILCIVGWLALLALAVKAFAMHRELRRMRATVMTAINGELSSPADGSSRVWSKEALKGAALMSPKQLAQLYAWQKTQRLQNLHNQQQLQQQQDSIALHNMLARDSAVGSRAAPPFGGSLAQVPIPAAHAGSESGAMQQALALSHASVMQHSPSERAPHSYQQPHQHPPLYDKRYTQHPGSYSAPPPASAPLMQAQTPGAPPSSGHLPLLMSAAASHQSQSHQHPAHDHYSRAHLQHGQQQQVGQVDTPPRSSADGAEAGSAMRRTFTLASSEQSSATSRPTSNRVSPTQGPSSRLALPGAARPYISVASVNTSSEITGQGSAGSGSAAVHPPHSSSEHHSASLPLGSYSMRAGPPHQAASVQQQPQVLPGAAPRAGQSHRTSRAGYQHQPLPHQGSSSSSQAGGSHTNTLQRVSQVVMLPAVTPEVPRSTTAGDQRYSGTAAVVPDPPAGLSAQQLMQLDRSGSPGYPSDINLSTTTSRNTSGGLVNLANPGAGVPLSPQISAGDTAAAAGHSMAPGGRSSVTDPRLQLRPSKAGEVDKVDLLRTDPVDSSRFRRAASKAQLDVRLSGVSAQSLGAPPPVLAELSPVNLPSPAPHPGVRQSTPAIIGTAQAGPSPAGQLGTRASQSPFVAQHQGAASNPGRRAFINTDDAGLSHHSVPDAASFASPQQQLHHQFYQQQRVNDNAGVADAGTENRGAPHDVNSSSRGPSTTAQGQEQSQSQGRLRVTFAGDVSGTPPPPGPVTFADLMMSRTSGVYIDGTHLLMPAARQYSLGTELVLASAPAPAPRLSAHTLSLLRKSRRSVGGSVSSFTGQGSSTGGSPELKTYKSFGTGSGIFRIRAPSVVGTSSPSQPPPPPAAAAGATPAPTASPPVQAGPGNNWQSPSMRRAQRGESDSGASQHSNVGSAPHSPVRSSKPHRHSGSLIPTRSEPRPPRISQDQLQQYIGTGVTGGTGAGGAGNTQDHESDGHTATANDKERGSHNSSSRHSPPSPIAYVMGGGGPFASSVMAALLEDDEDEASNGAAQGGVGVAAPDDKGGGASGVADRPLQSVNRVPSQRQSRSSGTRPSRPSPQATSPFTQPAAQVALYAPYPHQQQQQVQMVHRQASIPEDAAVSSSAASTVSASAKVVPAAQLTEDPQQHSSFLPAGRRVAKRLSESAREASHPHGRHSSGQLEMQAALSSGAEEGGSSSYDNITATGLAQLPSHSSSGGTPRSHQGAPLQYNTSIRLGELSTSQGSAAATGSPAAANAQEGGSWGFSEERDRDSAGSTGSRERGSGGFTRPAPALVLPLQRPQLAVQMPLGGGVGGLSGGIGSPGSGSTGSGSMLLSPAMSRQSWNARSSTRLWMTSTASRSFNRAEREPDSGRPSADGSERGSLPRAGHSEHVAGSSRAQLP